MEKNQSELRSHPDRPDSQAFGFNWWGLTPGTVWSHSGSVVNPQFCGPSVLAVCGPSAFKVSAPVNRCNSGSLKSASGGKLNRLVCRKGNAQGGKTIPVPGILKASVKRMCMQRSRQNTNNFGLYPWNDNTHDPSEMMALASGPFSSAFRHICVCGCCLAWKLDSQTHFCIGFLSDVDIGPTGTDCLLVANWSSMFLSQQRCSDSSGKSGTTVLPTVPLEIYFESLFPLNRDSSFPVYVSGRSQDLVDRWWSPTLISVTMEWRVINGDLWAG